MESKFAVTITNHQSAGVQEREANRRQRNNDSGVRTE